MAKLKARMQVWLDTGANWALRNPVLLHGELGVEQGSNRMKVGDGATPWNALPYVDMGRAVTRTGAPSAQDNAYAPGTVWLDQAGGEAYLLHGGGPGAAAWARIVRPEELADVLRTGRFATGGRASEGYVDKAVSAVKLESARSLSVQGDARAEAVAFDGTKDVSLELTLSSVMTPGAYSKVTVDGKGRVVDGAPLTEADVPSLPLQRVEGLAAALAGKQSAGGEAGALHASFDPAGAREMPASGDTLSTLWGKAARYLMDLGALAYKGAISRADVDAALEALLAKLDGVEAGAQVNAQADWAEADPAADGYIRSKPTALPADGGNADTVGGKSAEALMAYVEESLGAAGYGDMMRATYDADGDGVVDDAARLGGMAAAELTADQAVYPTAGTATAYTVTVPADVFSSGAPLCVKLHVDTGANPTLAVGGSAAHPMLSEPGKAFTGKAGGVYTFRLSDNYFFAQGGSGTPDGLAPEVVRAGVTVGDITGTYTSDGTLAAGDALSGKVGYSGGARIVGTMPNRGAVTSTLTTNGQAYTIPAGYHSGTGKVTASIANLAAANIKTGATVGGVAGNFTGDATATAAQLLSGQTAYAKGAKLTGNMANRGAVAATLTSQGQAYTIPAGYHSGSGKVTASITNLVAGNIAKGVNVGGVVGTNTGPALAKSATGSAKDISASPPYTYTIANLNFTPQVLVCIMQLYPDGSTPLVYIRDRLGCSIRLGITIIDFDKDITWAANSLTIHSGAGKTVGSMRYLVLGD